MNMPAPESNLPSLLPLLPRIRARFPLYERDALGHPRVYLNSGAGSLMVDTAIEAAAEANRRLNPMPGAVAPAEVETSRFHERVRSLVADFLGAQSGREITFHASTTAALFHLAYAVRDSAGPGDNVVVTDLDHMANISAWETVLGEGRGCEVRRARVRGDGTLDADQLLSLVDGRTRVLAVTMASNGFGTVVPLGEIIAAVRAKAPDCRVSVDAVHHALHGPIDVRAADFDFLAFSGYKVFGPMLGVLWGKEGLLEKIRPYRVETNKNEPPYKFEMGMLPNASLASLEAALEYVLWVGDQAGAGEAPLSDRRSRFVFALRTIEAHERGLSRRVLGGLRGIDPGRLTLFGLTDPGRAAERDPTFAFEIAGQTATETKERLWQGFGIQIADGNHYSAAVTRHLGKPALCRASFAHYDSPDTADRFIQALGKVAGA